MKSGVYCIENAENGHRYIGSSINLPKRKAQHFVDLKANKHSNPHLQHAYNRYGKESFVWYIIEYCSVDAIIEREQSWINSFDFDALYNMCPVAASASGIKRSDETRRKISERQIGKKRKPHTEEARRKMSEARRRCGTVVSEDRKLAMSLANGTPVYQIDKKTDKIIRKWNSKTMASRVTGIDNSSISQSLRGRRKTAGGYKWVYASDHLPTAGDVY